MLLILMYGGIIIKGIGDATGGLVIVFNFCRVICFNTDDCFCFVIGFCTVLGIVLIICSFKVLFNDFVIFLSIVLYFGKDIFTNLFAEIVSYILADMGLIFGAISNDGLNE